MPLRCEIMSSSILIAACMHDRVHDIFASHLFVFFQAERERDVTIEHLTDIDRLVNESLVMLSRYEDLVSS